MLKLDRMIIEEAGPNPSKIAAAIHAQLQQTRQPVPVAEIATALDIVEIRYAPLKGLEGALVAPPDRGEGAIVINKGSRDRRQIYTLAHELGHFLNAWHRPLAVQDIFACAEKDLATSWRTQTVQAQRHRTQEIEANRFAIELLAPAARVRPHLAGVPDLAKVIALADELEISREAAARRYIELHPEPAAVVFTRDGVVRYADRADSFPPLHVQQGRRLSGLTSSSDSDLTNHEEADGRDWLRHAQNTPLLVQTLTQRDGFAMTLLMLDPGGHESD